MRDAGIYLSVGAMMWALGSTSGGLREAGAQQAELPHFCYDDTQECGPSKWGTLADEWAKCSQGTEQSPVDISKSDEDKRLSDIRFDWRPTPLNIKNNGHTLQVNYEQGSSIRVNGTTYKLLQFHFHAPSEHTVRGQAEPMEVHMVHVSDDGVLAVVGVRLKEGHAHPALAAVLANAPEADLQVAISGSMINAASFLPEDRSYWTYPGSLTTPPCSEGVRWHVLQGKRSVSSTQVYEFEQRFHGSTARPVQPLNKRKIRSSDD
jgi:carbonic anhydrase